GLIDYQDSGQKWTGRAELAWANLAFAEPVTNSVRIDPIRGGTRLEPEQEVAIYSDWLTRDSELGLLLIEKRKFDLLVTTSMLRSGLERRLRSASVARTRYQALETINAGEPNP